MLTPSIGGSVTTSDIINSAGAEIAVSDRWRMWMESITRILDRPIFGYGAGTDTTWTLFEQAGLSTPHAHNIVLQILLIPIIVMALERNRTAVGSISMETEG